jgi:hypothetical protein
MGAVEVNKTFKVQISLRQPGCRRAMMMWHGSRLYGGVDSIF